MKWVKISETSRPPEMVQLLVRFVRGEEIVYWDSYFEDGYFYDWCTKNPGFTRNSPTYQRRKAWGSLDRLFDFITHYCEITEPEE